jgi:structure-specific endonuclease subunit SLX1
MMPWDCYLLVTCAAPYKTYIGVTVDLDRRLRQHNAEISGGAKRTTAISIHRGAKAWRRACHVEGFTGQIEALQFEWHWKHVSRTGGGDPLTRRLEGLQRMMAEDKWQHLQVVWESESCPNL